MNGPVIRPRRKLAWARFSLALGIAASALAATLVSAPIPARSEPVCAAPVIDETADRVLDQPKVMEAVSTLERDTGTDVFVRAFQKTPGGDSGVWWRDAFARCSAWLGADGRTPKPNIVVVEFGLDHTSAIEYGSNLHRLDTQVDGIRSRKLGEGLRRGDFTGAVTSTLNALNEAIKAPAPPAQPVAGGRGDGPNAAEVGAFFLKSLLILVLAVLSYVAGRLGLRRLRNWLENRRRLQVTLLDLQKAKAAAAKAVLGPGLDAYKVRTDDALARVEGPFELIDLARLETRIAELSGQYADLDSEPTPRTAVAALSAQFDYESIAEGIDKVMRAAEERAQRAELRAEQCTIESKRADLQAAQDRAKAVFGRVQSAVDTGVDISEYQSALSAASEAVSADLNSLGGSDPVQRPDIDTDIANLEAAASAADSAVADVRAQVSWLADLSDKAKQLATQYEFDVPDVAPGTRVATLERVRRVHDRIEKNRLGLRSAGLDVDGLASMATELVSDLTAATAEADGQRRAAQKQRDAIRRKAEEEERAKAAAARREREERAAQERAERRRRESAASSSSYSSGFSGGYISGSYSSGSSDFGGGFSGGGDFGGGSSGSW